MSTHELFRRFLLGGILALGVLAACSTDGPTAPQSERVKTTAHGTSDPNRCEEHFDGRWGLPDNAHWVEDGGGYIDNPDNEIDDYLAMDQTWGYCFDTETISYTNWIWVYDGPGCLTCDPDTTTYEDPVYPDTSTYSFWWDAVPTPSTPSCNYNWPMPVAERAYCGGAPPTGGTELSLMAMAVASIQAKSALCDSIGDQVNELLANGRFRFYTMADTNERPMAVRFKTYLYPNRLPWAVLDHRYITTWWHNGNPTTFEGYYHDLTLQLAHIGEHLLRESNTHTSGRPYTSNAFSCSDLTTES